MAYDINGVKTEKFPTGQDLDIAKPVYQYFDGWMTDISGCRNFEELPENAQKYIKYIQDKMECPIKYISVGPEREQYIEM